MAEIQTISLEELQQLLQQGSNFHFWNVLTDQYFKGDMIPGSHRVPLDHIEREAATGRISKDAEIVVYCGGPSCPQSRMAAEKLSKLGFTNVRAYEGGIEEWKNAGYRTEQLKVA